MAPLMVGDFVTINGIEVDHGLLVVYSLVANLGLYTAPRENRMCNNYAFARVFWTSANRLSLAAYIRVEEARAGVPAPANAELGETRAVAYTTDPSTPMQFYAIDVDPCTGVETERDLQLVQPLSQNAGGVWGKTVFRLGKVSSQPMTKNVGFKLLTGTSTTINGLKAGIYIQPVFLFIFPELLVFGDQMFPFGMFSNNMRYCDTS